MVLLYLTLGYSALIGGTVILLLSPLQYKLAQCFSGIQKKTLVSTLWSWVAEIDVVVVPHVNTISHAVDSSRQGCHGSGSSGRVRGGGEKHEIYEAAFGSHLFYDLFSQDQERDMAPSPPPRIRHCVMPSDYPYLSHTTHSWSYYWYCRWRCHCRFFLTILQVLMPSLWSCQRTI